MKEAALHYSIEEWRRAFTTYKTKTKSKDKSCSLISVVVSIRSSYLGLVMQHPAREKNDRIKNKKSNKTSFQNQGKGSLLFRAQTFALDLPQSYPKQLSVG